MGKKFQSGGKYEPHVRSRNEHGNTGLEILAYDVGLLQEEMGNSVGDVWRGLKSRKRNVDVLDRN